MTEAERLRRAIVRLKRMLSETKNPGDKVALDTAIEHIDARLIDIKASVGENDYRSSE